MCTNLHLIITTKCHPTTLDIYKNIKSNYHKTFTYNNTCITITHNNTHLINSTLAPVKGN